MLSERERGRPEGRPLFAALQSDRPHQPTEDRKVHCRLDAIRRTVRLAGFEEERCAHCETFLLVDGCPYWRSRRPSGQLSIFRCIRRWGLDKPLPDTFHVGTSCVLHKRTHRILCLHLVLQLERSSAQLGPGDQPGPRSPCASRVRYLKRPSDLPSAFDRTASHPAAFSRSHSARSPSSTSPCAHRMIIGPISSTDQGIAIPFR